jgi:foldase protein PrsA
LAVAWVDGKPITIFSYYHALDQKYGKDTKDQMISEQLVTDEAAKRGVSVSQDEVNSQIKLLEDQASGSANLNDILAQQGLTRSDFEKQIKLQSLIKKMFDSEASVSSQDVDNYIQQNKSQLPDPVDDKTKQSITDQLKQQKLVQAFQTWLSGAQNSNRVIKL